jgi:hypothetical protein
VGTKALTIHLGVQMREELFEETRVPDIGVEDEDAKNIR